MTNQKIITTSNPKSSWIKDYFLECPKCHSNEVSEGTVGFSAKKAVVGAVLTGGIGFLFGFHGRNRTTYICGDCSYRFKKLTSQEVKKAKVLKNPLFWVVVIVLIGLFAYIIF